MLLKSGNYIVYLLKRTSDLDFNKYRLCNTDHSGLRHSVNITNPCSKLLYTEVREVYQIFRNQTLYV